MIEAEVIRKLYLTITLTLNHDHRQGFSILHLAGGNYHMSLEIVLQKEVSKGNFAEHTELFFPVSIGTIILTDDF